MMKWTQEQQQKAHLDCKEMMLSLHTQLDSHPVAIELACQRNELLAALKATLPILGDRSVGGRMITPQAEAGRVFSQAEAAIEKAEGE